MRHATLPEQLPSRRPRLASASFAPQLRWRSLMARRRPMRRDTQGTWIVAGYREVAEVLRHPGLGKRSAHDGALAMGESADFRSLVAGSPLAADGKRHESLRREMALRGTRLAEAEAAARTLADRVVAAVDGPTVDAVADLAQPLALGTVEGITGCPAGGSADAFHDATVLARMFESTADDADTPAFEAAAARMRTRTRAARRHRPEVAAGLFTTGLETATSLSSAGVGFAAADPDLWAWLRAADGVGRRAYIEEVARLVSPVQFAPYSALEPVTVAGHDLVPGEELIVLVHAANCDPTVFDDPELLRPGRDGRHLAFGLGAHACIGGALATTQARALLDAALTRWSSISVLQAAWRGPAMVGGLAFAALRLP